MNKRTLNGALSPVDYRRLEHGWIEARRLDYPFDARFNIKPATDFGAAEAAEWFKQDWNWLGGWCRRNVGVFYAVATREAKPNRDDKKAHGLNEHFHFNVHIGGNETLRKKLRDAWRRRRPGDREVNCSEADYEWRIGPKGEHGNNHRYIAKQCQNWQKHLQRDDPARVTRQSAGLVLGKRYRISANLRGRPANIEPKIPNRFRKLVALARAA